MDATMQPAMQPAIGWKIRELWQTYKIGAFGVSFTMRWIPQKQQPVIRKLQA